MLSGQGNPPNQASNSQRSNPYPAPPRPSPTSSTPTTAVWTAAGDSSALTCPTCAKKFDKGSSQQTVNDHMLSKACKECELSTYHVNFQQHLEDRQPQWRLILSHDFLSAIQISSAEQQALGIPHDDVIDIHNPSFRPPSRGQKRPASSPPSLPSRRANKENEGIPASNSIDSHAVQPPKIRKVILKLPLAPALQKNSHVK
ncbi:hypothetical protein B0H11DRAFT_2191876 [Mycena galericulata]|nr:hypothetical protein B0H11DRAFT_2191876 [Mycena galericulata]